MSFFVNINNRFPRSASTQLDGSIVLCSAMPMHQLERRRSFAKFPHMTRRLFDPQLYMAPLEVHQSPRICAKLATYPWFGISGLQTYSSGSQTQTTWMNSALQKISALWKGAIPSTPQAVDAAIKECVDFQLRLGCEAIILPSPLTSDPSTSYADELLWLDAGLRYTAGLSDRDKLVFATVAFADICARLFDPQSNPFLDLVSDTVSSRSMTGVYIVVEQGSEPDPTRNCGNTRVLGSVLRLVHLFSQEARLRVAVNFLGMFGLVCEAAGADIWGCDWYKSLYRFRLADKIAGGRAFPTYWSYPAALDIHLEADFDALNKAGIITGIADRTTASVTLLNAARRSVPVRNVLPWQYRSSNVATANEHFLLSAVAAEARHGRCTGRTRRDMVEDWLVTASQHVKRIEAVLGNSISTKTQHVAAWSDAFLNYRSVHKV